MYKIEVFNNEQILQAIICVDNDNIGYLMKNEDNISLDTMLDIIMEQDSLPLNICQGNNDIIYSLNIKIDDDIYFEQALRYYLYNYTLVKIAIEEKQSIEEVLSSYLG